MYSRLTKICRQTSTPASRMSNVTTPVTRREMLFDEKRPQMQVPNPIGFTFFPGATDNFQEVPRERTDLVASNQRQQPNLSQTISKNHENESFPPRNSFKSPREMPQVTSDQTLPISEPKSTDKASVKIEDVEQPSPRPVPQAQPENFRPSRFANCIGYDEPDLLPTTSRRQLDDLSAITEELDMYEKIREQPAEPVSYPENIIPTPQRDQSQPSASMGGQANQGRSSPGDSLRAGDKVSNEHLQSSTIIPVEDNMFNMLYQQARILESKLEKKHSFES